MNHICPPRRFQDPRLNRTATNMELMQTERHEFTGSMQESAHASIFENIAARLSVCPDVFRMLEFVCPWSCFGQIEGSRLLRSNH